MTDTLTKEHRSYVMSRIRSRDTKPEKVVRSYLFSRGLRFRVNVRNLPGHPDVVLAKYRAIVEIRGCFWHRHPGCATATTPKSHIRFWREKFKRNVARDKRHEAEWAAAGWRLFVVWECELAPKVRAATLEKLYGAIVSGTAYAATDAAYTLPEAAEDAVLLAAEEAAHYDAHSPPR